MLKTKQVDAISIMLENPELTYNEVATMIGVSPSTFSRWRNHDEEFIKAYKKEVQRKWEWAQDIALDRMVDMAKQGEFKACKYILDTSEYAPVDKKHIEGSVDTTINIGFTD